MLDPPGPRLGDVQLLRRRRDPQVAGLAQVPAAPALAPREMRDRSGPGPPSASPSRARRAACRGSAPQLPAAPPGAASAAAYGPARHPRTAASSCSRCCGTAPVPAAPPAPAAPRSGPPAPPPPPAARPPDPPAPRSAHPGQRKQRNPGQQAAERTQVMIIQSRPLVSKPTRSAHRQNRPQAQPVTGIPATSTGPECVLFGVRVGAVLSVHLFSAAGPPEVAGRKSTDRALISLTGTVHQNRRFWIAVGHPDGQCPRQTERRFPLAPRSQCVTTAKRPAQLRLAGAPPGEADARRRVTWRRLRRRRRRYRWRAGPGCRGRGHTASWCSDQHATRLLGRRAAGPQRRARR